MVNGQLINGLQITNSIETSNSGITVCSWEVPQDTSARVEVTCLFQQQVNSNVNTSYKIATNVMRQDGYASLIGDSIKFDEEGTTAGFEAIFDIDENSISVITASADGYSYRISCFMNIYSVKQFIDGYSLLFDGTDEYVTMGDVLGFDRTDTCSFSAWIKTTGTKGAIAGKWGTYSPIGYIFTETITGLTFGMISTWATDGFYVSALCDSADNIWHHVVVTFSGNGSATGVKFYLDGILLTNEVPSFDNLTSTILNNIDFQLGKDFSGASAPFEGNLDEISIYNKELSLAEVQAIYDSGSPTNIKSLSSASNMVGYWRCGDEDTYPTILDHSSDFQFPTIPDETSNSYNGTATNMEVSDIQFDTPGSQALVFDGTDEYVTMGNVLGFESTDAFSWSGWIKTTTTSGGLFGKYGGSPLGYLLTVDTGAINFYMANTWSTNGFSAYALCSVNDGNWHHVTMTYSGNGSNTGVKFYFDGGLLTNETSSWDNLTSTVLNTADFQLGVIANATPVYLAGSESDVAIWNKELSVSEVSEIYNNKVPINLTTISCASDLAAWWRCGERFSLATDGVPDFSGNGLHGTQVNMEITDVEDRTHIGKSMAFGGTDEYMTMGNVLGFEYNDAFSYNFWIKTTNASAFILSKMDTTTNTRGYSVYITSTGIFQIAYTNIGASSRIFVQTSTVINDGLWHLISITYDGSGLASGVTYYLDAEVESLLTIDDTLGSNSILNSASFNLSGRDDGSLVFSGSLNDVSIWDKGLSLLEIEAIYNAGIPTDLTGSSNLVGYWKMGDGVGFNGTMTNMEEADIVREVPH